MENDDVQLVHDTLSGNEAAFSTLIQKYQRGIHALAWRKVGDFHHAEEITQDTFLQAYTKLHTLRDPNKFARWLYVIADRLSTDWLRRQRPVMQSLEDTPVGEMERFSYAHHIAEQRETEAIEHRFEIVKKLLTKLPERERTVVTLHYLGEMTVKEIGKCLGVSVNTITSRLRRAQKRLRDDQKQLIHEVFGTVQLTNLSPAHSGKVRDLYDLGDQLLIVSTDRISAFDVVLPNGIPDKGKVLTGLSKFWFDYTESVADNHLITTEVEDYPEILQPDADLLRGRSMLVQKVERVDVECVVRGYLAGSGWSSYQKTGEICGQKLPDGLQESDRLPELLFTPTTKAEQGEHDEPISIEEMRDRVGSELTDRLIDASFALFHAASQHAENAGIILCDTKFEFGQRDGKLIVIDEVFTPDSSRFWPADLYEPGKPQQSFDKQFVRDYLTEIGWNKRLPAPELPETVISKASEKYREAYRLIVGEEL